MLPTIRDRSLFMTGVGAEEKMVGQLKKLACLGRVNEKILRGKVG